MSSDYCKWSLLLLLPLLSIVRISGNTHTFGNQGIDATLKLSKLLFSQDDDPDKALRNYTIVFKLLDQSPQASVTRVELIVPGFDTSTQVGETQFDRKHAHSMEVTLSIPYARNVSLHLNVYTSTFLFSKLLLSDVEDNTQGLWLHSRFVTRSMQSFTAVHVQRVGVDDRRAAIADDTHNRTTVERNIVAGRYNAIGQRQSGDQLIYFRTMNVTNLNNFAMRDFVFDGNAGQKISYVGFSFDSPTAVAFVNTSFVLANKITAIVYDLTEEQFVANMSVFGYESGSEQPNNFRPILQL